MPSEITAHSYDYVKELLQTQLPAHLTYHNWQHTKDVVAAAIEIGQAEGVNEQDLELLILASLFHDVGHTRDYNNHEEESQRIAEGFLSKQRYPAAGIQTVKEIIGATKIPQAPHTLLQQIICDADLRHLANGSFQDQSQLLRQEWIIEKDETPSDKDWAKQNLDFLRTHQYFTNYGKTQLEPFKLKIIKEQKKALKQLKKEKDEILVQKLQVDDEELKNLQKKLKKVEGRPDRGIETLFRTTSRNHLDLSSMADSKANILISVNSIIISITVGALSTKIDSNPHLLIPMSLLLMSCLTAITFAILATRPNVTKGNATKKDIEEKKTNLLFFGNFHNMSLKDYEWGMKQVMADSDYLYSSLIRDIYFLGVVLERKYRLLRIGYTIFMFGLIISVAAFIITFAINPANAIKPF